MARLSPEKRDEMLIRVDERTEKIPVIEKHLKDINGTIAETNIKLAKTEEIANEARDRAKTNSGRIDKITITAVAASIAALAAIASAVLQVI